MDEMFPEFRPTQQLEPGRPVVARGADDNVVLELARFPCKAVLECEQETVIARCTGGSLDDVQIDERRVIADNGTG